MKKGIKAFFSAIFSYIFELITFFGRLCLTTGLLAGICWAAWHYRILNYDILTVWMMLPLFGQTVIIAFAIASVFFVTMRRILSGLRYIILKPFKGQDLKPMSLTE
jgi:hypothetical protein